MINIGLLGGQIFSLFENKVLEELKTDLPSEEVTYPKGVNSITSALVKDRFTIDPSIQSRIVDELRSKRICVTEDPRHILHCYYILFRNRSSPDYVPTLYSLTHNVFQKNQG
jgi:hypothetical protein